MFLIVFILKKKRNLTFQINPQGKLIDITINNPNDQSINQDQDIFFESPSNILIKTKKNEIEQIQKQKPKLPEGLNIVLAKRGKLSEKIEEQEYEKKQKEYEEQMKIYQQKLISNFNQENEEENDPNMLKPSQNLPTI